MKYKYKLKCIFKNRHKLYNINYLSIKKFLSFNLLLPTLTPKLLFGFNMGM
jgi:hypothetical protein